MDQILKGYGNEKQQSGRNHLKDLCCCYLGSMYLEEHLLSEMNAENFYCVKEINSFIKSKDSTFEEKMEKIEFIYT